MNSQQNLKNHGWKALHIYSACEKIISQLGKNIFPVGAILFCSWDFVFRQLLHEYTA